MNPATPTAPLPAIPPSGDAPPPAPSQVGEQALNQISTFNSTITQLVRTMFPDLAKNDRVILVDTVLTIAILLGAGLLYALCNRLRSPAMRFLLRITIGIATIVGLLSTWVPGVIEWFDTPEGVRIGGSALTIFISIIVSALLWEGANRFLLNYYLEQAGAKSQRLRTLLPLFRRFILVFLIAVTTLTVMTELGVNIAPLLAGAGVIGIAIGFGAQKLAQDFITGLFIVLEDALALGDIVTIDQHSGVVEDITLRTVRLRDVDGAVHILPFSSVQSILNRSKGTAFAMIEIGIGYDSDLLTVEATIRAVMDAIRQEPQWEDALIGDVELMGVDRLEASAIIYKFRQACPAPRQFMLKREMLRRVVTAFSAAGIDIPFPTVTQVLKDVTKDPPAPPAGVKPAG